MLNLAESGRQIGEELFALLTVDQKKELTQYVLRMKPAVSIWPITYISPSFEANTQSPRRSANL